jgi:ATP-binding cassette subfamily F protein 3
MLRSDSLALRRGSKLLFSEATFAIHAGWRVGITGRNGAGKSSFLALVSGEMGPDAGTFERPRNWTLAHVRQETPALESSAIDYVLDGDTEWRELDNAIAVAEQAHDGECLGTLHEKLAAIDGYTARSRAGRLLHGLGFSSSDENRPVRDFSGGWRMRLNLATALMCRSDLLLLDEPTNHLDLDAVVWLETWLKSYPGTLLLISHDREFLDTVVSHILSIADEKVELFAGNLSGFERKRAERLSQTQSMIAKQQRERAHLQGFIDRFRAQATKARQAQSRLKALERMTFLAPIRAESSIRFEFRQPHALPQPLLKMDEVSVGYGERVILDGIKFNLVPGQRIALLGANGAGKSTLIKMLAGTLAPLSGERLEAKDLRIGYFAQHQLEQLDHDATPVEHLKLLDPKLGEQVARDFLGGFGFNGERALEKVAPFSGGEKARLCLAMTVYQRPNLLLLDEPTNHLDLDMREGLTEALQDFAGAMVLVSHDRSLIRACCDTLLKVTNGCVSPYEGDLDDYAREVVRNDNASAAGETVSEGSASKRDQRRERAEARARLVPLRNELGKLEKRMVKIEQEKSKIDSLLLDPALYDGSQASKLADLVKQQGLLKSEFATTEEAWLGVQESLEQVESA